MIYHLFVVEPLFSGTSKKKKLYVKIKSENAINFLQFVCACANRKGFYKQ